MLPNRRKFILLPSDGAGLIRQNIYRRSIYRNPNWKARIRCWIIAKILLRSKWSQARFITREGYQGNAKPVCYTGSGTKVCIQMSSLWIWSKLSWTRDSYLLGKTPVLYRHKKLPPSLDQFDHCWTNWSRQDLISSGSSDQYEKCTCKCVV